MKLKTLTIVLIFSLGLNLAVLGTYIFKKVSSPPDFFPPENRRQFMNELGLDKAQREEMFTMMHEFREKNRAISQEISDLERELFQTIRTEDADSVKINSLIEKIGQMRIARSKRAINHFKKYKQILTTEQQDHFYRMIMEKRPGRFNRPGGWHQSCLPPWRRCGPLMSRERSCLSPLR